MDTSKPLASAAACPWQQQHHPLGMKSTAILSSLSSPYLVLDIIAIRPAWMDQSSVALGAIVWFLFPLQSACVDNHTVNAVDWSFQTAVHPFQLAERQPG